MAKTDSYGPDPLSNEPSDAAAERPTETTAPDVAATPPRQIGRFHIRRTIASGGMGTVYEALQEHPRRTVALKVMKHGITSRSALRRFEYESQILARLHHPGIAQVYEAGTHDDGSGAVPFFAMEYIPNAKRITQYSMDKKLSTRQRMELFAQVCDAVNHGHQKGIIHRDLKPGNILVDSAGEVKIIDFGVARGTDSDLAVTTLQTDVGQLIGTLQYMSPEQCEADPHDIDTRSDVYALGVVLYELLSGKLPYDLGHKPVFESTRVIREQQPTRLSTADRTMRGDVETIVFKALEKDRDRRYQSAVELAQDVRRHLAGEAITARPPSIAYQLRLFARRHRALFIGTAVVFAVFFVGAAVSTALYVRAELARAEAAAERDRAVAINEFFKDMLIAVNPRVEMGRPQGRSVTEITAADLLHSAGRTIEKRFADQPELEAETRGALGAALINIGDHEAAKVHYRRALELCDRLWGTDHERTLQMKLGYGRANRELPSLREAYDGLRRLHGLSDARTLDAASYLAGGLIWDMQLDQAEAVLTEALAIESSKDPETERQRGNLFGALAFLHARKNDLPGFEANARKEYEILARTDGADSLGATQALFRVAYALSWQGHYAEAKAMVGDVMGGYRRHLGMGHPAAAFAAALMAEVLINAGDLEQAERLLLEAIEAQEQRFGAAADNQFGAGMALGNLAELYVAQERYSEAQRYARRCLSGMLHGNSGAPELNNAAWTVAKDPRWEAGLYALALEAAQKACALQATPEKLNTLGVAQYRVGAYEEALATLRRVESVRGAANASERDPCDVAFMAMALHQLGRTEKAKGELAQLRELMQQSRHSRINENLGFLAEAETLIEPSRGAGRDSEGKMNIPEAAAADVQSETAPDDRGA